jgi:hypothetical protein
VALHLMATFPFPSRASEISGELASTRQGEGEGGWLCACLQRRGDAERGQMASAEGEERGCWVLFARDGFGSACRRWMRFVGLGGSLGTASWTMSSGVSAGLECVPCKWAGARVQ